MVHAKQASISHPQHVFQSANTNVIVLSAAHFADVGRCVVKDKG